MRKLYSFLLMCCLIGHNAYGAKLNHHSFNQAVSNWNSFNNKSFTLCKLKTPSHEGREHIHKVKVHFENNNYDLDDEAIEIIKKAMNSYYVRGTDIEIHGHADIKGANNSNEILAAQRTETVFQYIWNNFRLRQGTQIRKRSYGERRSTRHHRSNRFVEIRLINPMPDNWNINQVILIDGSRSLRNNLTYSGLSFRNLKRMTIPRGTIAYVVRDPYSSCRGDTLSRYTPDGRTFVKEAMGTIAYYLQGKAKVTIYSDGVEELDPRSENYIQNLIKTSKREQKVRWFFR